MTDKQIKKVQLDLLNRIIKDERFGMKAYNDYLTKDLLRAGSKYTIQTLETWKDIIKTDQL